MKKLTLFFLLIPIILHSQQDSLKLIIVYPSLSDTVNYDRIRISGSTNPGAKLTINSDSVKVYPSGAFGYLTRLDRGLNEIIVESRHGEMYQSRKVKIYRLPPIKSLSEEPTAIESIMMEPSEELMLVPGDVLKVRFKGSPSGKAKFNFGKWGKNIPMQELPPEKTGGVEGIYTGSLIVKDYGDRDPEEIEFKLKGKDGSEVKVKTSVKVKIYSNKVPIVGRIKNDDTIARIKPDGAIFTSLQKDVKVQIDGKFGKYYRIKLKDGLHCFIHKNNIDILPPGSNCPYGKIGGISVKTDQDHYIFKISISDKCPYKVEEKLSPARFVLNIYNAYQGGQWLRYPENDSLINFIKWTQAADDIYQLNISFSINQLWGYKVEYEDNFLNFYIKKPPKFNPEPEPALKGVRIVLDPGHGGEHLGAIGGTGITEKEINLNYSLKLAKKLQNEGANVIITRSIDTTMFLSERYRIADSLNADIFVWLHNNSIGLTSDPFQVKGTSTYYTHPHSFKISGITYKHLKKLGLNPFGNISTSFYITRQTSVLTFLVEGAFLSNPEDEMLLMDDNFLSELADAVFKSIKEFAETARREIFLLNK